jgi:hypothetical protein
MAEISWENEHPNTVIHDVEIGNTTGKPWVSDEVCRMLSSDNKPELCMDCQHNEVCTVGDQF